MKRSLPLFAVLPLLALGLVAPTAAAAAPAQTPGCDVVGADLDWGFKESFRAYIDGSIANGEWIVSDGAVYATPEFGWRDGSGRVDPSRSDGSVDFTGSVRFTGHGGLLDFTIANPVLRFDDASTATLLLDVSGVTMEGDPIESDAQEFVRIDLSGADLSPSGGQIVVADAPTTLTDDGAVAFPNYESGEAFDLISFTLPVGDCALTAPPAFGPTAVIAAIIAAMALIAAAAVVVIRLRRRP